MTTHDHDDDYPLPPLPKPRGYVCRGDDIVSIKSGFAGARRMRSGDGFLVLYDRRGMPPVLVSAGWQGGRWLVMHEPTGRYVTFEGLVEARAALAAAASCRSRAGAHKHVALFPPDAPDEETP